MIQYIFVLGTHPELSALEVRSLIRRRYSNDKVSSIDRIGDNLLLTTFSEEINVGQLMAILGGTIKILKVESPVGSEKDEDIIQALSSYLLSQPGEDRIVYSFFQPQEKISSFSSNQLLRPVKTKLQKEDTKCRYIENKSRRFGLSASVLLHQDVFELALILIDKEIYIARSLAVQDIDDWTQRDRERPFVGRKRGMLPLKVSRILVNIGLSFAQENNGLNNKTFYDPFCGCASILMEAAMVAPELKLLGSDLDTEAVKGSRENMTWLEEVYDKSFNFEIFKHDATQALHNIQQQSIDCIVTEPFLGEQTPKEGQIPNIIKGLYKMYTGVMKRWREVLTDQAIVIMIWPKFSYGSKIYRIDKMFDKVEKIGYNPIVNPLVYARPGAKVQREIHFFKYQE